MSKGFIKLDRKLLNWGWFNDEKMVKVWIYLLLTANHQDGFVNGVEVKRGQKMIGRKQMAKDVNLSEQTVRTCLNRLKSTNEITIKSTKHYSLITIVKYDEFQGSPKKSTIKSTNESTNSQPTANQQSTTNKNVKNDKKEINIYKGTFMPTYDPSKNIKMTQDEINELLKLRRS